MIRTSRETITLNWTNPTDPDFDHVQIDRTDGAGNTVTLTKATTATIYTDTTPVYATTYTYTLYTVDLAENKSAGTTTSYTLANPTPSNILLLLNQTSMTVRWTASSAPTTTIAGYRVYYGTSPTALTKVMKVGNTTTTTLTGLSRRTLYYVAVSAVSTSGVESGKSVVKSGRTR